MTNSIVKGNSRCDMIAWSELGHGDPSGVRLNAYIELGVCTSLFILLRFVVVVMGSDLMVDIDDKYMVNNATKIDNY